MKNIKVRVYRKTEFEIIKDFEGYRFSDVQGRRISEFMDNSTIINNKIISNADSLDFTEDINSGQSGIDIDLLVDYNCTRYKVGDFIEYSIYDSNNKNGLLKFSGIIKKIKRNYNRSSQGITLECESITSLLSKKVNKTYSGTYKSIVDDIITDIGKNSCNMEFLGTQIFKNRVQNNSSASITVDGTLLEVLKKLFENKTFFINQFGEITDTFIKKHILVFGRDIFSNETEEDETGIINADLEVSTKQDINAGDLIKIVNTESFLCMDGEQITKLDFNLNTKNIFIGKINQIKVK